ncbi:MAG: hypothetical protein AB7F75_09010 [Planctomycetota bacterium]
MKLTRNRSVYLSTRRRGGALEIRASRLFLKGDESVLNALASYCRRPSPSNRRVLGLFFTSIPPEHRAGLTRDPVRLLSRGRVHDLKEALDRAMVLGFPGGFPGQLPRLGWSRSGKGRGVHRLGSYERGAHTIRIHPCLDDVEVPLDFVASVVFHELLHALYPPVMGRSGRWVIHSKEFRRAECLYSHYAWARSWERRCLDSVIKRQKSRVRR